MASNFCWCLSFCFAGSSYLFVHQQEKEVTYLNYLIYKFIHLVIFSNMYKSTYPKALEPTSMKWLGVFLLPLDGMLVHRKSFPPRFVRFSQQFAGTHLYSWVERGTVRVKCLAQEHNIVSPARARTRTTRSGTSALTTRPPRLPSLS